VVCVCSVDYKTERSPNFSCGGGLDPAIGRKEGSEVVIAYLVSRRHPSALGNHLLGPGVDIGTGLSDVVLLGHETSVSVLEPSRNEAGFQPGEI